MKKSISIKKAKISDAKDIYEINRKTWFTTYINKEAGLTRYQIKKRVDGLNNELKSKNLARFKERLKRPNAEITTYLTKVNGKIVGYTMPGKYDGIWRVGAIYILKKYQSLGIGDLLINKNIEWHNNKHDIYLEVAKFNKKAINFYKKHGFVLTNRKVVDSNPRAASGEIRPIPVFEMVRKVRK